MRQLILLLVGLTRAIGNVILNEIANKGSRGVCDGEDWIELYNTGTEDFELQGYKLCDDKGCEDDKAYTFPQTTITAKSLMVLCKEKDFAFGIGSGDSVSFVDPSGTVIDTTLLEGDGVEDVTWSRVSDVVGTFRRTRATPSATNSPLILNEIASKGSSGVCNGEDWVEIYNPESYTIALDSHMLCDDKGCEDEDAYTFPVGTTIGSLEFKIVCNTADFKFGIGSSDIITLLGPGSIKIATVPLPGYHSEDITWSRVYVNSTWTYDSRSATPGSKNGDELEEGVQITIPPPSAKPPPPPIDVTCPFLKSLYVDRCCGKDRTADLPDLYTSFTKPNVATKCIDVKHAYQNYGSTNTLSCCDHQNISRSDVTVRFETIIEPDDEASFLYDDESMHSFKIDLSPSNMKILDDDPIAENYVPGNVTFMGKTYTNVGIRYKGSVGSWVLCVAGSTPVSLFTLSGRRTCDKLNLKIAFDEFDDSQRFFGLRKILFHAMNHDPSRMKERIGYRMFREMGVPSPRVNHAIVEINGRTGLYANVEYIDDVFTQAYFGDGGYGNLFKEVWPSVGEFQPDITKEYLRSGLRTNKGTADMTQAIKFANDVSEESKMLEQYVRISHLTRWIAVDTAIGHNDGARHMRCFGSRCEGHNFYFYEESDTPRYWFIPWDLDDSFAFDSPEVRSGGTDLFLKVLGDWRDLDFPCGPVVGSFGLQLSPSCDSIYRSVATNYMNSYTESMNHLFEHSYYKNINSIIDTYAAQIKPAVDSIESALTPTIWSSFTNMEAAIVDLKKRIVLLREKMLRPIERTNVTVVDSRCAESVLPNGLTCKVAVEAVGCDFDTGPVLLKQLCPATCGTC